MWRNDHIPYEGMLLWLRMLAIKEKGHWGVARKESSGDWFVQYYHVDGTARGDQCCAGAISGLLDNAIDTCWCIPGVDAETPEIPDALLRKFPQRNIKAKNINAPNNNDGRTVCFWCGNKTKEYHGFMSVGNVCIICKK